MTWLHRCGGLTHRHPAGFLLRAWRRHPAGAARGPAAGRPAPGTGAAPARRHATTVAAASFPQPDTLLPSQTGQRWAACRRHIPTPKTQSPAKSSTFLFLRLPIFSRLPPSPPASPPLRDAA
jgi:hypothetical protein